MINYSVHENGWAVIVNDFDLRTATQRDIDQISKLLVTNTLVVVKKQTLTVKDEIDIIKMFHSPAVVGLDEITVPDSEGLLLRSGGWKDSAGVPGIAAHQEEMAWHFDFPYHLKHWPPLVWLYAVSGATGSKTSWTNHVLAYNDLDQTIKDLLEPLNAVMLHDIDFNVATFYKDADGTSWPHGTVLDYTHKIVTNGRLFFPFNQIYNFVGMSREESKAIIIPIMEYLTQHKYQYTHDWEDGDVVFSDQYNGVHKRWPFKEIDNRLLHRATFEYTIKD